MTGAVFLVEGAGERRQREVGQLTYITMVEKSDGRPFFFGEH